jgi:DNA-binding IclR family transcriptional regulator
VVERVRSAFIEMRGFSPTLAQAARLFDLPAKDCDLILIGLVQNGFLGRTPDGRYHLQA